MFEPVSCFRCRQYNSTLYNLSCLNHLFGMKGNNFRGLRVSILPHTNTKPSPCHKKNPSILFQEIEVKINKQSFSHLKTNHETYILELRCQLSEVNYRNDYPVFENYCTGTILSRGIMKIICFYIPYHMWCMLGNTSNATLGTRMPSS